MPVETLPDVDGLSWLDAGTIMSSALLCPVWGSSRLKSNQSLGNVGEAAACQGRLDRHCQGPGLFMTGVSVRDQQQ